MSFVIIGERIINIMAISLVDHDPEGGQLTVHVVGVPEPLVLAGREAEDLHSALAAIATPLSILKRT